MKQNADNPSVIEKFRRQCQRTKRHGFAFLIIIAIMIAVPLVLGSFPSFRNQAAWKVFGSAWLCLFTIALVALGIVASFDLNCPACGKNLGRSFSIARHCPYCGTKLTED
jgi:hypothetical protein